LDKDFSLQVIIIVHDVVCGQSVAAERARVVLSQPLCDAVRVELVPAGTRHDGDLLAVVEVLQADRAPCDSAAPFRCGIEGLLLQASDRRAGCGDEDGAFLAANATVRS
jgi:hypothetical protein